MLDFQGGFQRFNLDFPEPKKMEKPKLRMESSGGLGRCEDCFECHDIRCIESIGLSAGES